MENGSLIFSRRDLPIKFVSGLQSDDGGFAIYSSFLNQENWTSRYNRILLKVRLTTNDT